MIHEVTALNRHAGQVRSPLFVGIVLSATSLGLVAPILKDAGESEGEIGQLVLAAATIADFGTVILLSLLFSGIAGDVSSRLAFLGSFVALVAAVGFGVARAGRRQAHHLYLESEKKQPDPATQA